MFGGAIVAIVTPFKNGEVDESRLRELIEFQIENGMDGIVPCGTTGESTTLSHEEHDRVIEITIDAVKKRVPVIAGTGSNSTAEAIRLTRHAYEAGADGVDGGLAGRHPRRADAQHHRRGQQGGEPAPGGDHAEDGEHVATGRGRRPRPPPPPTQTKQSISTRPASPTSTSRPAPPGPKPSAAVVVPHRIF